VIGGSPSPSAGGRQPVGKQPHLALGANCALAGEAVVLGGCGGNRQAARTRRVYAAGDLALLIVDWSIAGTSRQGYPIDLHGTATDVIRRNRDGHWRYVIDNPFGIAEPEPGVGSPAGEGQGA
jgi:ketosteroid isomerase-like protein